MLILTAFWVTIVTLIKASMVIFGAGLALFLFSSVLVLAVYNLFLGAFIDGVEHV